MERRRIAEQRRFVGKRRQYDVGDDRGGRDGRAHHPGAGPQRRPLVGVERHPGAALPGKMDGPQELSPAAGIEDGKADAGKIRDVGAG